MWSLVLFILLGLVSGATSDTSMCDGFYAGTPIEDRDDDTPSDEEYAAALEKLDIEAVTKDMSALLTDSKECWPADFGNYGPFFIRLAWHCSGSYRTSDGRGGCGGGRQRFEPERSWEDNTHLDKARALVSPLKKKYGHALSWGDLFILAGTTALRDMNTPVSKMCFGRVDDSDGTLSLELGPTPEQESVAPCAVDGQCKSPFGSTTKELIYVNPEGTVLEKGGKPIADPSLSVADIRDVFERMGHNDRDTVALIGGGHAFGKTHGACPNGAGDSPQEAYSKSAQGVPWPGLCGSGKGNDTFTSGFEGPWTTEPLKWDNQFFKLLLEREWEKHVGPANHWQWRIKDAQGPEAGLMRLTSDMALLQDPKYLEISREFASDMQAFDDAFDAAWWKLTTRGGRWSSAAKCDSGDFPAELRSAPVMRADDFASPPLRRLRGKSDGTSSY